CEQFRHRADHQRRRRRADALMRRDLNHPYRHRERSERIQKPRTRLDCRAFELRDVQARRQVPSRRGLRNSYLAKSAIASSASTPPEIAIGANGALAAISALEIMI